MTESPEQPGRHAAPDDDPNSDPPPVAGEGGEHAAEESDGSEESGADDADADQPGAGSQTEQPGADPDDEDEIQAEREERLDPDNRPDGVEIDNTDRDFDAVKGMFTDSEGYEEAAEQYAEPGSDEDA